jgi:hypothetical protein
MAAAGEILMGVAWVSSSMFLALRVTSQRNARSLEAQAVRTRHAGTLVTAQFVPVYLFLFDRASDAVLGGLSVVICVAASALFVKAERLAKKAAENGEPASLSGKAPPS